MGLCNPARPCPHNCPRRRLQIPSPFPWAIDHFIDLCPVCNAVLNYGRDHVATAALAAQAREREEFAREESLRQAAQAAEEITRDPRGT